MNAADLNEWLIKLTVALGLPSWEVRRGFKAQGVEALGRPGFRIRLPDGSELVVWVEKREAER